MRRLLCFSVTLLLATVANSADWSIEIGSETLSVGMSEARVYKRLEPYYRIDCQEGKVKTCILMNKDGPPWSYKANIVSRNGKLTQVRKYWSEAYDGTDPSLFVRTLYDLVSLLAKEGPVTVTLEAADIKEPGIINETVFITRGHKTISISVLDGAKIEGKRQPALTTLTEIIGQP